MQPLEKVSLIVNRTTQTLNLTGSILIIFMAVVINTDVMGRNLFGTPLSGVPEMVSMSIVAIVFLQVAYAVQQGKLTRSDALLNKLGSHYPQASLAINILFNLVACFMAGCLLSASYPFFIKAWDRNSFIGSIGDFTAPVWPIKLIILIGCFMLLLQFMLSALLNAHELRLSIRGERT
ncbi:TRAP transporter small permease [Vibrio aquaticus]|uniref:TRAP transporter small permease protein n=1 Tax=Vibrio aquaticus TaxID=2496559 RepID=A0A3S0PQR0_9VIBR|nr:TRAP transporter small permease [Vibrio aquaticus]RTZ17793.1 TRAP transporter small permease [Vibrio aquaticus]